MAEVDIQKLTKELARNREVRSAVRNEANDIAGRARALLASHRHEGDSKIETKHGSTDSVVSLVDNTPQETNALPAVAIEYGHTDKKTGKFIPGLYIITKAARF